MSVDNSTWVYFLDHLSLPAANYSAIFEAKYASDMTQLSLTFTYDYKEQLIITIGSVAGAGILALLLFWFFMSMRWCCTCIRCLPRTPTDEEIEKYNIPLDYYEDDYEGDDDDNNHEEEEEAAAAKLGEEKKKEGEGEDMPAADDEAEGKLQQTQQQPQERRSVRHYYYHHPGSDPAEQPDSPSPNRRKSLSPQRQQQPRQSQKPKPSSAADTPNPPVPAAGDNIHVKDDDAHDDASCHSFEESVSTASSSYSDFSQESWRDMTKRLYPYTPKRLYWLGGFIVCALIAFGCSAYIFLSTQQLTEAVVRTKDTGSALYGHVQVMYNSSQLLSDYGTDLHEQCDQLQSLVATYANYTAMTYYQMQLDGEYIDPLCAAMAYDTAATQTLFDSVTSALESYNDSVSQLDNVLSPLFPSGNSEQNRFDEYYHEVVEYYYADGASLYVLFGLSVTAVAFLTLSIVFQRRRAVRFSWVWLSLIYLLLWIVSVVFFSLSLVLGDFCTSDSSPVYTALTNLVPYVVRHFSFLGDENSEAVNLLVRNLAFYSTCTPALQSESTMYTTLTSANALLSEVETTLFSPLETYNFPTNVSTYGNQSCMWVVQQVNASLTAIRHETAVVLPSAASCPSIQSLYVQLLEHDVCTLWMRGSFRLWGACALTLVFLLSMTVCSSVEYQFALSWDQMKPPYDDDDEDEDDGDDEDVDGRADGDENDGEDGKVHEPENAEHDEENPSTGQASKKTKKKNNSGSNSKRAPRHRGHSSHGADQRPNAGEGGDGNDDDDEESLDSEGEIEVDAQGQLWLITPASYETDGVTLRSPPSRRCISTNNLHDHGFDGSSPPNSPSRPRLSPSHAHTHDNANANANANASNRGNSGNNKGGSGKKKARPASLRSILTVEYWTRPLPPTPTHPSTSTSTSAANPRSATNTSGGGGGGGWFSMSSRALPAVPGSSSSSQRNNNNNNNNNSGRGNPPPTPLQSPSRRRPSRRPNHASPFSDTVSVVSSLSANSLQPPLMSSSPPSPHLQPPQPFNRRQQSQGSQLFVPTNQTNNNYNSNNTRSRTNHHPTTTNHHTTSNTHHHNASSSSSSRRRRSTMTPTTTPASNAPSHAAAGYHASHPPHHQHPHHSHHPHPHHHGATSPAFTTSTSHHLQAHHHPNANSNPLPPSSSSSSSSAAVVPPAGYMYAGAHGHGHGHGHGAHPLPHQHSMRHLTSQNSLTAGHIAYF